ncbi:hypothetical protein ACET3Z_013397 [Daucus carota]
MWHDQVRLVWYDEEIDTLNKKKDKYKRWKKEHEGSEGRSRRREPSPRRINFDTDEEAEEEDDREDGEDHDEGENQDDSEDRRNTDDRDRENNEEDREDKDELREGSLSIFDRMGRRLTLRDLRHRLDDRRRRMQERLEHEGSRSRESRGSRGHTNHRRRRPPSPPSGSSGDGSSYSSSEESHAPRRRRPPRHRRDQLEEFSDGTHNGEILMLEAPPREAGEELLQEGIIEEVHESDFEVPEVTDEGPPQEVPVEIDLDPRMPEAVEKTGAAGDTIAIKLMETVLELG